MITLTGTYDKGYVKFNQLIKTDKPVQVEVTFLEEVEVTFEKPLQFSDFSFEESRKIAQKLTTSVSDTIIEERRNGR